MLVALEWLAEGRRVVAASLVETVGSAPLDPGAVMLVDDAGRIEGSVTGGCVEGALVEEAQGVLAGAPPRVATYGISDQQAADVGLMCGGTVKVFVHELHDAAPLEAVRDDLEAGRPVALATVLDGPTAGAMVAVREDGCVGGLGHTALFDDNVARDARGFLDEGRSDIRRYSAKGETMGSDLRVAIDAFATPPRMVVFGAIDFSAALARIAEEIGYRVTIVDAREAFARSPRFSAHAEVVISWPDVYLDGQELGPRDAVLVFTHDPKFDEPALLSALRTGAGYIGALGSRRTHADREQRLREAGVADDELRRISSPCGLDVGARTPAETAIAVLAEVLALRAGRRGGRLAEASGPIHPRGAEAAV
ncbi:MAG: XdhC family protein [Solirubrobacterales bacterium]|nr:XdhC family protein [Solirubrobacterales bacterium]